MRCILISAATSLIGAGVMADPVLLTGSIGPYQIEAEVSGAPDDLTGRYRYQGRDAWLDLSGEAFGQDALRLIEQVDGETTGTFYLDVVDGGFEGVWVAGETEYPAALTTEIPNIAALLDPNTTPDVSEGVTGRYSVGEYWVNGLFAPNYEIGFNGGDVNVVSIASDIIYVSFDFVVGPTYHIASFRGLAGRTEGNTYVHDLALYGGDEPCVLIFAFENGGLDITDENNRMACGFGARAHADFNLLKVSDIAEFDGSW